MLMYNITNMSVSGIINPTTNQIYDILVPQGGGVPLIKGQLITADGNNKEVAFPTSAPANGSVLSYNSNEPFGLKYIPSSSIEIDYQELLSSNASNVPTVILPPAQNGYILTANTSPSNPTGLAWEAVGGTGKITATLPLVEEAVSGASNLYINFTGNVVGEIPYGNGIAKTGALTNVPTAGQILGINNGIPTWIPPGGSGTITALYPLTEYADGTSSKVAVDFVAKGDLIAGAGVQSGGNPISGVILTVGANDMVLTANSNTPSGLEWKAQGSGSSPIIYRNTLNNQPLLIAKPATENDTMILISDRIYNDTTTQVYNEATVGSPGSALPVQGSPFIPIPIYLYTPASNETLTSFTSQIYFYSNSVDGLFWKMCLYDSTNSTILMDGGLTKVGAGGASSGYYPFQGSGSVNLVGGTNYYFSIVRNGSSGDTFQLAEVIVGFGIAFTGNITATTRDFTGTASFVNPPGSKFLIQGQPLSGFTSAQLGDFTGQTYISSGDANNWVAVGSQPNAGIAYTP